MASGNAINPKEFIMTTSNLVTVHWRMCVKVPQQHILLCSS